ncbi:DUF3304 domain-containing protein [uncultured Deefgea sp.]|uniref:DUF3304 domain-containing protein n=1 Tax=uncultured Deefgea sp. TaxID=1304914 RepID=UPI002628E9ED|nr:DUF3304 domain-containing protein [uncultured Deefgea sp.]
MYSIKYLLIITMKSILCALLAFGCLLLSACDQSQSAAAPAPDPNAQAGGYVDVVNYNHLRSYRYTLRDWTNKNQQEIGGGIIWPLSAGGNVNCCIQLPKQWHAGLKLRVDWQEDDQITRKMVGNNLTVLDVPQYSEPGNLYISMLPDSQIELVVSKVEPGHPEWPGKIKQTPWDYCVATAGRKACKAAIPKTFSVVESKGFCTYLKRIGEDMALCDSAMRSCMEGFEDQELCTQTLWGEERQE